MNLHIVILAAGQGKRMYSDTPKVLHPVAGKPMLARVVETARELNPDAIHVIYGHCGEQLLSSLADLNVNWIHQKEQLGTGHALMQALPHIPPHAYVLVLSGDVPLIKTKTLALLIEKVESGEHQPSILGLLVAQIPHPFGLGRIVRNDNGDIYAIVEEKDASEQEKKINEIYSGICCAKASDLALWLPQLGINNAQNEYYLTEIIPLALKNNTHVTSLTSYDWIEIQGVNNRLQLQQVEREWQLRKAQELMESGVTLADAQRFDLRGELICGKDVTIDINCLFTGKVILGDGCKIGPNCILSDVTLGSGCEIYANSLLEGSQIAQKCYIGPFARLRAGTQLASNCKIGNFVETKKATFGEGSKASHLSYLGDVSIGKKVNIGAGTITCNYDGVNKYQTIIEDGAFIGSDTQLIAPVSIGANATIGAGSTIRKNAPADELTYTETRQITRYGWERKNKKE